MLRILTATLASLAASALLTIWAHLFICAGMDPEGVYAADVIAPYLGLIAAILLTRKHSPKTGALVGTAVVFLWFLAFGLFQARFALSTWPRLVFARISLETIGLWTLAIIVGALAGWGEQKMTRWRGVVYALLLLATPLTMAAYASTIPSHERISPGVTVDRQQPDSEGTIVRVVTCDLGKEPGLSVGLYDADSDDDHALDDHAASYYGQPALSVSRRIDAHLSRGNRRVRCLVNGGFFGADNDFVGFHIAPIVVDGKPRYPSHTLSAKWKDQACGFAYYHTVPHFGLVDGDGPGAGQTSVVVRWASRPSRPHTLLAGLRKLRVEGVSVPLKPGLGGTTLRCSRTSIGWNKDGTILYILNVREPDGEAGSIRQRDGHNKAAAGWDVRQVQEFWEQRHVDNAILFDSGESTQLVTPSTSERSANHAAYTLGYWRNRPIRIYVPIVPSEQNTPGVLNYLYLDGPNR